MPAMAVESGPAAGVVAAALVARQTGRLDLLSFDMGGTTAKASLIRGGHYETTPEYEVGGGSSMSRWMNGTGHPIRVPVIDLAEVSAGGGSIAWVDRAGALRVGPKSAGADPGPGVLRPRRHRADGHRLQSPARLSRQRHRCSAATSRSIMTAAAAAVRKRLAEPLAVDARTAAAAVIDVVNHAMAEALKIVSVQRGHDPRDFALAAFGGAGPLHAAALAKRTRHCRGHLPADSGSLFGARARRHRLEARLRANAVHHGRRGRSRSPGGCLRRPRDAEERPCSIAPASRPRGGGSSAPSMRAIARQSYELVDTGSSLARSTRPRWPRSPPPSTIVTCTPMATTIAASRCRSSAFASPPSARSRRWRSAISWRRPERTRSRPSASSGSVKPAWSTPRSTTAGGCRRDWRSRVRW